MVCCHFSIALSGMNSRTAHSISRENSTIWYSIWKYEENIKDNLLKVLYEFSFFSVCVLLFVKMKKLYVLVVYLTGCLQRERDDNLKLKQYRNLSVEEKSWKIYSFKNSCLYSFIYDGVLLFNQRQHPHRTVFSAPARVATDRRIECWQAVSPCCILKGTRNSLRLESTV